MRTLEIKLFSSANSIELTIYFLTGEFEKGLEIIPQIEAGLILYEQQLNSVRKAFFYFNIAIIYFGAKKYNDALKWTNRLLNDIDISKSLDIYCFGQLLNLLVHIELNNKNLLPYALRSTQRYLSTRNRYFKFETSFLDLIGKLLKSPDQISENELYEVFLETMRELKDDQLESSAFEYFDFISWAEAKASGREFGEVVREKATMPQV
jgi:tetratricopeptide (TPR) repeat protein